MEERPMAGMETRVEITHSKRLPKDELVGWTEKESVDIKCGDCGTPLVNVVLTEHDSDRQKRNLKPQRSQYRVKCYKCGGYSFHSKVFCGSTVVGALKEGVRVDELDTEMIKEGIVFVTLSTEKE